MSTQQNRILIPIGTTPVAETIDFQTPDCVSLIVTVTLEAYTSGSVTVTINGVSASGEAKLLLASTALGAAATTVLRVCPVGVLAASANVVANAPVPPTCQIAVTVSSPVGITYHVDVATTP